MYILVIVLGYYEDRIDLVNISHTPPVIMLYTGTSSCNVHLYIHMYIVHVHCMFYKFTRVYNIKSYIQCVHVHVYTCNNGI